MEIPRNFYYLVEKKGASGEWESAAELRAPKNAAELKANMLNMPAFFRSTMPLQIELADFLWERQKLSPYTDSLYAYSYDPKIMVALGCGWFDDGLKTEGDYQYRVSRVNKSNSMILSELRQRFPENLYKGTLNILKFTPNPDGGIIQIYYHLNDPSSFTYNVKLYRSRLLENDYKEVPSETALTSVNDMDAIVVSDESVTKGMTYSYIAVPYDFIGNMGTPSTPVNIYNMSNMADIGILSDFKVVADKDKKGVTLTWKMTSNTFIMGYEIFRSQDYDGSYKCIATLPGNVTSFFDDIDINPGETYFYYVTVNNGYGNNVPSARTPAVLEGTRENFLPPQDVIIELEDNVVRLMFGSIKRDTRGYQIYRAEGYTGELFQIAAISVSAEDAIATAEGSKLMIFCDTLQLSGKPKTFSYAVADINSSYNISPLSERVSIQFSGGMLPAPMIREAMFRDNSIIVVWEDVTQLNAFVTGYNVWRSALNKEGVTIEEFKLIATTDYFENLYIDTELTPGTHYRYVLESIGINGETSGKSIHAGVLVPSQRPLPPGQISAIASDNRILLRWDNPIDPTLKNIRIYRATSDGKSTLLKELPANQSSFEDKTVKKDILYLYYIVTVNNRGEESKTDDPVSAKMR